jgi:type I site-specific restriction-modification system R (restriction) subunit
LSSVLKESLIKINNTLPVDVINEAVKKIINISYPKLIEANHEFHRYFTD